MVLPGHNLVARLKSLLAAAPMSNGGTRLAQVMLDHAGRHPGEGMLTSCSFPPTSVIITKGQLVPAVYILVKGALEVIDAAEGLDTAPIIATLQPPTVIGEIGQVDGGKDAVPEDSV